MSLIRNFGITGTLIRDLELLIPATSDRHNFISLTPVDDDKTKATESNLSDDSYHVDDLCSDISKQFTSKRQTPHAKYHTPQEAQEDGAGQYSDTKKILKAVDELKTALSKKWSKFDATNN
ncbi:hypothetical protein Glove_290g77 [Diversispora epigaea]|uniref:Uncharacterized protein n=1 Tax=Diversispora epigaea TaxID=1348612 RepID=A0A397I5Q0_9GLOM|nr:hypothetical protein Glove_290g77 [Diversispora epigaea]